MAEICANDKVALRPHTKTHRCAWIAHKQIALGATGVAAATLNDAEALVKAGVPDVLVTSPIPPSAAARLGEMAELAEVSTVVDNEDSLRPLAAVGRSRGLSLPVLVDVDVGHGRTGVKPAEAGRMAQLAGELEGVGFAGLQGYEGHCMLAPGSDRPLRERCANEAYGRLSDAKESVIERGIAVDLVTGAGTGTHAIALEHGIFTEIQPGSYCVMDATYGDVVSGEFEHALLVLASVLSSNQTDGVTVDAGWKAISVDAGVPIVGRPQTGRFRFAGDEHGKITGVDGLRVGDHVQLIPSHCDTTIHLHDHYTLTRDDGKYCGVLPLRR